MGPRRRLRALRRRQSLFCARELYRQEGAMRSLLLLLVSLPAFAQQDLQLSFTSQKPWDCVAHLPVKYQWKPGQEGMKPFLFAKPEPQDLGSATVTLNFAEAVVSHPAVQIDVVASGARGDFASKKYAPWLAVRGEWL